MKIFKISVTDYH